MNDNPDETDQLEEEDFIEYDDEFDSEHSYFHNGKFFWEREEEEDALRAWENRE